MEEEIIVEDVEEIISEYKHCPHCGLPNYMHDGSGFCPAGTEELGGRR